MTHSSGRSPLPVAPARLLVVLPTTWDQRQLEACRAHWAGRFDIEYGVPSDADCPADLDALALIRAAAGRPDLAGVFSASDYPGATLAAAIATVAGWPGPRPEQVLRAAHKLASRELQSKLVPEAVPRYCLVDPARPGVAPEVGFPCFVKPIRGAFGRFARRVDSLDELATALDRPEIHEFREEYLGIFNRLWAHYVGGPVDGRFFIAEELLPGRQVTVEGFVADGAPEVIGIVDSELHPGTGSFSRFVYPSTLPPAVQERMTRLACRCIAGFGLARCFFNIEMTWDELTDRIGIIEINPRMCGQFADLYEKVDGINSYVLALELASGAQVRWQPRGGTFACAASVPLRVFEPARIIAVPDAARLREVQRGRPGTLLWAEVDAGQVLADFDREDGASARYAVINLGAQSRAELDEAAHALEAALGFRWMPLAPPAGMERQK